MPAPTGRFTRDTAPDVSFAGQYRLNDPRRSEDFGHRFGVSDYYFEERQLNEFRHGGQPPGGTLRSCKPQQRPQSWACSRASAAERKSAAGLEATSQNPGPSAARPCRPASAAGLKVSSSKSDAGSTEATWTTRTSSYGASSRGRGMTMRDAFAQAAEPQSRSSSTTCSPCKKQIASAKPGWEWCTLRQAVLPIHTNEPAGCELGLVHAPGAYHQSIGKLQRPRSTPALLGPSSPPMRPATPSSPLSRAPAGAAVPSARGVPQVLSHQEPPGQPQVARPASAVSPASPASPGARRGRGRQGRFETSAELGHAPLDAQHYSASLASQPPRWRKDKSFASFKL